MMNPRKSLTRILGASLILAPSLARPAKAQAVELVKLTVDVQGPNSGSVDLRNLGLCSTTSVGEATTCEYSVPSGTAIQMSANVPAPSTPGVIAALGGSVPADCALKTTCSFAITEYSTLTVAFDFETYHHLFRTISINLAGAAESGEAGADNNCCQNFDPRQFSGCTTAYALDSEVTIEARPPAGALFLGFSGGTDSGGTPNAMDCSTTPCQFPLQDNASVTATFAALGSIRVDPSSASRAVGETQLVSARGTFVNGASSTEAAVTTGMGTWKFKADMPTARFGLATGVLGGQLYALGGVATTVNPDGSLGTVPLATVEAFDPSQNAWSLDPPDMSIPRESPAAAVVGGTLYAIGGATSGGSPVSSVEAFDGFGWNDVAGISIARRSLAAGVVNGKVYAVGGQSAPDPDVPGDRGDALGLVEEYDPATGNWTTKAPMPTPRWALGVGVVNGILYALGGKDASSAIVSTVEAYDPVTDTWTTKASMPSARELHGVAVIDGQLYAVGGNFGGFLSSVAAYDPARDGWFFKAFMAAEAFFDRLGTPTQRGALAAASIDGILYAVGGQQVRMEGSPPEGVAVAVPTLQAFTDNLVWGTSDASVATITQFGQARGQSAGTATLTARTGMVSCEATGTCGTLTVTPPAIRVNLPSTASTQVGSMMPWACVSFSDPVGAAGAPWSATVDYGDGTRCAGGPGRRYPGARIVRRSGRPRGTDRRVQPEPRLFKHRHLHGDGDGHQ